MIEPLKTDWTAAALFAVGFEFSLHRIIIQTANGFAGFEGRKKTIDHK